VIVSSNQQQDWKIHNEKKDSSEYYVKFAPHVRKTLENIYIYCVRIQIPKYIYITQEVKNRNEILDSKKKKSAIAKNIPIQSSQEVKADIKVSLHHRMQDCLQ